MLLHSAPQSPGVAAKRSRDKFNTRRLMLHVVAVELGAVQQAARLREDRRDMVRAHLVSLLVLAVMAGDSA